MTRSNTSLKDINAFLTRKRIALVGASTDKKDFSRVVMRELIERGYDIIPVNPAASCVEDRHCYARLSDIQPPVEGVLVMTPPSVTEDIVRECVEIGVNDIWLHRSMGQGSISPNAVSYCKEHKVNLIEGHCPMMFFKDTGLVHRIHRGISKLFGSYPK
jgi:hypothetical protein